MRTLSRILVVTSPLVLRSCDAFLPTTISTPGPLPLNTYAERPLFSNHKLEMSRRGYEDYFAEEEEELKNRVNEQQARDNFPRDNNNDSQQPEHGYRLARDAGPIPASCHLTEDQIHKVIAGRREYQQSRQYAKADQLLEGLNRAGVFVHDKRQEWRADGLKSFGGKSAYVRRGGNSEADEQELEEIGRLIEQRCSAKKQREFRLCDQLEATLTTQYKVQLDDKRREWSFLATTKDYVPSPLAAQDHATHTMPEERKAQIQQLIRDRVAARNSKHYKEADAIRDDLFETHSVVMDDRTREWKVVTDESDPFWADAVTSQRSAFVRKKNARQPLWTTVESTDETAAKAKSIRPNLDEELSQIISGLGEDNHPPELVSIDNNAESSQVEPDDTAQEDRASLATLTVVALKEKLREAGLPVSGKKADLVDRLLSV